MDNSKTQEAKKKAINEAAGLAIMAGSNPSDIVFPLLERYVGGTMTMQDIRDAFDDQFFKENVKK